MIGEDLIQRDDNTLSYSVFKEIYSYAKNCKSLTELEDFLDKFQYQYLQVGINLLYYKYKN